MINIESGHLTPEDRAIMKRGADHPELGMERKIRAIMGYQLDRRDWMLLYHCSVMGQFGPAAITFCGIDCRGWTQE